MGNIESGQILATMWDNFDVRVKEICKFYHITKLEMAIKIGSTQSNLSILNNGKQHHTDAYRILLGYPDINARWLLFGEGDMLIQKEAEPQKQPDPAPEGVTILDKEGQVYKYLYEMKDKECQSLTRTFAEEIGKLKRDNDHLTAKLRQTSVKPYSTEEVTPPLMAAEPTDNNN
jgi:hypothetical protein